MAIYCIGDLHGQYGLFCELLSNIQFDPLRDRLYLLGDVIDWNYGGIKIIDYLMSHTESCVLIRGNHEDDFLYRTSMYDCIMSNPSFRKAVQDAVEVYSSPLFSPIENAFASKLRYKKREAFYTSPTIRKWFKSGAIHVREKFLRTMVDLAECINYDRNVYTNVISILNSLHGQFKTKAFVQELLEQTYEHYQELKEYLRTTPWQVAFEYDNTQFHLSHYQGSINPLVRRGFLFPHANTHNVTYIFGHDPVPNLHRKMKCFYNTFDFDYRKVFKWVDTWNNRYYHLDLASNPICALKLDDMSEYYVDKPSDRPNAQQWHVTPYIASPLLNTYRPIHYARLGNAIFSDAAILSLHNGCYEFIIGVASYSRCIYYSHVSLMDCHVHFTIDDWFIGQTIPEIIERVRSDFESRLADASIIDLVQTLQNKVE